MATEYTIISVTPGRIAKEESKSITLSRSTLGATGSIVETDTQIFFVSTTKVILILAAIDTGDIHGIPAEINRPNEAEAVQCAVSDYNCDKFIAT